MVATVITFNIMLALACLYLAWQVWRLRRFLARVADVLTVAERRTHRVLSRAPHAIRKGQVGVYQLRQELNQLEQRLVMVQQYLGLLGVGMAILRRRKPLRQRH